MNVPKNFQKTAYERRMKALLEKIDQVADEQMKREKRKVAKMEQVVNQLKNN